MSWAVGTTYTLDLIALLSAPVAFAFADCQDRDGRPIAEPLALLKAVRQYAGDICLFCQAGKIQVPRSYQPLLASLEDSIVEATAPLGGSFHPKLWFLRFVQDDGEVLYRVLCLSRNLTFDRSWDTILRLDGQLKNRANAYAKNHPLGEFVDALPKCARGPLAPRWRKRLEQIAQEIRRVEFTVPEPFEDMAFWALGLNAKNSSPFPLRRDRALVISPFVDDGTAELLTSGAGPVELVSRPENLEMLQSEAQARFSKLWILDDGADSEPSELELTGDPAGKDPLPSGVRPPEPAAPLTGLHAKLYVFDQGWRASVWTGSANATRAGLERNVEFLVQLMGKKSQCGVAAVLGESSNDAKRRPTSLAQLLQPFAAHNGPPTLDPEVVKFEREVDALARDMSLLGPSAVCESVPESEAYGVEVRASRRLGSWPRADWQIRARPVSLPSAQLAAVDLSQQQWVRFAPLTLLGLTSFFVFNVESSAKGLARQFVLNIPLKGAPANRQEGILRDLLSDQGRVLRFLLLLLMDSDPRDLNQLFTSSASSVGQANWVQSLFGATLFESLVHSLERDAERLDQVAALIDDLKTSPESESLLPEGFNAIWDPIWQARCRQRERSGKSKRTS
jgi:hypothetical protein